MTYQELINIIQHYKSYGVILGYIDAKSDDLLFISHVDKNIETYKYFINEVLDLELENNQVSVVMTAFPDIVNGYLYFGESDSVINDEFHEVLSKVKEKYLKA